MRRRTRWDAASEPLSSKPAGCGRRCSCNFHSAKASALAVSTPGVRHLGTATGHGRVSVGNTSKSADSLHPLPR